jgi:hypothetical protein
MQGEDSVRLPCLRAGANLIQGSSPAEKERVEPIEPLPTRPLRAGKQPQRRLEVPRNPAGLTAAGRLFFLSTHMPNIGGAFPQLANSMADGEALVFGADGKGGAALLAHIKIEDWPKLGE